MNGRLGSFVDVRILWMVLVVFSVVCVNEQRARHVPYRLTYDSWRSMARNERLMQLLPGSKSNTVEIQSVFFFFFIRHSAQFTSLLSFLFFLFSFNFIVFIISWMDCKVLIRQVFVSFPDLNRFVRRREKKSAFALGVSSLRDVCHDWK